MKAYPLSSGSGVRASRMMGSICNLAGLTDVGVKARAWPLAAGVSRAQGGIELFWTDSGVICSE